MCAHGLGLTSRIWGEGYGEFTQQFGRVRGFSLKVLHARSVAAVWEGGAFTRTTIGQHLETAANRVGLTIGRYNVTLMPQSDLNPRHFIVEGRFRTNFSPYVNAVFGTGLFLLFAGLQNTPAETGTPNVFDPHFMQGVEEEGTWPLRALIALVLGRPEPSDVPRHIRLQREALQRQWEADKAEEARQQAIQSATQFQDRGEGGAGHSL